MATTDQMHPGTLVYVKSGPFKDHQAKVIDPKIIPDGGDHRAGPEEARKVLVELLNVHDVNTDANQRTYILPRLLDVRRDITSPVASSGSFIIHGEGGVLDQAAVAIVDGRAIVAEAEPITDPMDPALDRYRPNVNVVKKYISRTLPGGYTDVDYLLALRDQRDAEGYSPNVALVGETQSGKTMFVQVLAVLAAERDGMPKPYPVYTLSGSSGVTNYDIFGQTTAVIIDGRETLVWMEGLAAIAAKAGGFLYLDEWNAVSPGQAVALHCLLDDRRQFINTQKAVSDGHGGFAPEVVKANPQLWVVSTINPGYKGTQTMAEATSNRFRWLEWDYDEATEKALIPSKSVRMVGARLREAGHQRIVTVPVGTSVLQRFNADCAQFGVENAVWSFLSLFPPTERERARTIIEDGGLLDLLVNEYPEPMFKPGVSNETTVAPGATWEPDSLGATTP